MKPTNEPMTFADIETILTRAARICNHRRFVIAGSLSAIGAVMTPPPEMVMSRDLDMYPQLDPGRGFIEISSQIGEGSSFHVEHGFYADPITPKLLALPEGWESRITPISMSGGIVAMFLDPNDVAIGKLMRGNDNDLCWVRAGLAESLLNAATILQRERTATNASMDEHQRLRAALIAMTNPESASAPDVPKG